MVSSPVGLLSLKASEHGLTHLQVDDLALICADVMIQSSTTLMNHHEDDSLTAEAKRHIEVTIQQLAEYFSGTRPQFSVTLAAKGTEFQQQVWQALSELAFGESCSYSDIANIIGRPKAVRAVGAANGANPIAIIVPCHRVIGKGGKLTGYAYGLDMKQWLLNLEASE
ncbi:methylated-DNA--[protein]-cysteine S-methyltransferase [Shewanella sp. MF05960]|uniref:methylated-DNA--[protein]-cysteine S-methyltransferase n=1 Tax=Shewanella sp. MF05960 TaxID=3434874 RepID=UPI003D7A9E39